MGWEISTAAMEVVHIRKRIGNIRSTDPLLQEEKQITHTNTQQHTKKWSEEQPQGLSG